jgi:hypothetical protein
MEVVSNLRQISDTLREMADRVLEDVQAMHTRMVGELERVARKGVESAANAPDAPAAPASAAVGMSASADATDGEEELDVPDFVARG